MKTNEITLNDAMNNEYSLYLNCASGKVFISYFDEDGEHNGECNDAISYDRYNELRDWCEGEEDEKEFLSLYKYFVEICD